MNSEKKAVNEDNARKLLFELIACNTANPPGNESRATTKIKPFLRRYGIKFKEFEKQKGRSNLIAYVGKDSGNEKELMIVTHLDTVPAGEGWKTNPFKAVEKNGKIFGLGAEDDKGNVVAALLALKELKKKEKKLRWKFSVAMLADEEKGSKNGMDFLLEKGIIKPDYAIVCDNGGNLQNITVGEKARVHLKITAKGKQAHGSTPEKGINAINAMAEFLTELNKIKLKGRKMKLFSPATINVGKIQGGTTTSMVPAKCEAMVDIRYLPNQNLKDILKQIRRLMHKIERRYKARFCMEVKAKDTPWVIDSENVLVKKLKEKTMQVTGKKPKISGLSGATDARKLIRKGCITVGFGAGKEMAHSANEYIELKQVLQLARIIELVAEDFLNK